MTDQSASHASVYVRSDAIFVVSEQKNVFGILQTGDALARLDPTATPRELGQAVIAALAAYGENAPGQLYVQGN